jgi:HD-like signal output (HDOD) protein
MGEEIDIDFLRKATTVSALPRWQLEAIADLTEHVKLKKGAKLIKRGTDDGFTYFLTAGKVALEGTGCPTEVVEADTQRTPAPLANLRPRILDVTAMGRVQAIRVPDLLLRPIESGDRCTVRDPFEADCGEPAEHRQILSQLPFEIYRDLKKGESSVLPSLPDTAVRIQLAVEDEISDADAVARRIATDPAIAAKLIMTANSPLYGGRTPVETLTAAVVRLGLKTTCQLVLTFAMREVFRTRNKALRWRMKELWDHSAYIAAACFVLSLDVKGANPEEALLVGLIHDIGTIAIINSADRHPELASDPESLEQTISCLRGELGALILREWRFAPAMIFAARDAENWGREHRGAADFTDVLIVAQFHDRLRRKETEGLPRIEEIPAFTKVLGENASPEKSVAVINQSEALVDALRKVLSR